MKILCKCKNRLSTVRCPNPIEGKLIGAQDYEKIGNEVDQKIQEYMNAYVEKNHQKWLDDYFGEHYPKDIQREEVLSDITTSVEQKYVLHIMECDSCGRLLVQKEIGSLDYYFYEPENKNYNELLKERESGRPRSFS